MGNKNIKNKQSTPAIIQFLKEEVDKQSNEAQSTYKRNVFELIEVMQDVNIDTPEAKLNETSISDNNGGRIKLVDDPSGEDAIKK